MIPLVINYTIFSSILLIPVSDARKPALHTLSLCSSFRMRDQVLHPYKTTRALVFEAITTDVSTGLSGTNGHRILPSAGRGRWSQFLILHRAVGPQAGKEMDIFGWGAACGRQ